GVDADVAVGAPDVLHSFGELRPVGDPLVLMIGPAVQDDLALGRALGEQALGQERGGDAGHAEHLHHVSARIVLHGSVLPQIDVRSNPLRLAYGYDAGQSIAPDMKRKENESRRKNPEFRLPNPGPRLRSMRMIRLRIPDVLDLLADRGQP